MEESLILSSQVVILFLIIYINHMKKVLLLLTCSLILLAGCKEDDEQMLWETNLKQGWILVSEEVNGIQVDLTQISIPELMYFGEQSLCYLATPALENSQWGYNDLRTAWSYDHSNKILNIAGLLPVTNYIDVLTGNRLEIHYYRYNESGDLDTYEKVFSPAQIKIEGLKIRLAE